MHICVLFFICMFGFFADNSSAKFDKKPVNLRELNLTAAIPLLGFNNTDFFISPKNLSIARVLTEDFLQSRLNITLVTRDPVGSIDTAAILDAFLEGKTTMDSWDMDIFFDFFDSPSMVLSKNTYDVHLNIIKNHAFIGSMEEKLAAEDADFFASEELDNFNILFDGLNFTDDEIATFRDNKNSSCFELDEEVDSFMTFLENFQRDGTSMPNDDYAACDNCLAFFSLFPAGQITTQVDEQELFSREQKQARPNFAFFRLRKITNDLAIPSRVNKKIKNGYFARFYPPQRFYSKPSCRNRK